jgi:transcriptional regulator with XRE-family HTH domain
MVNRHALRIIRERSGLSISVLASQAGISQPHLSNIESGRRQASPAVARRLAAALKVPVVALVAAPVEAAADAEGAGPDEGPDPGWIDLVRRRPEARLGRRCRTRPALASQGDRVSGPCRGSAPRRRRPG